MCFPLVLVFLLGPVLLALLLVITCAPATVPYLLLTRPDDFHQFWFGWILALIASPFVAYWLAGRRPALTQRLKARRAEDRARMELLNTAAGQRARKRRRLLQTAVVLPTTSVIGLVSLEAVRTAQNTLNFGGFVVLMAVAPVTAFVLGTIFGLWDRRFPPARPGPGSEP
jgi:MFS family permease